MSDIVLIKVPLSNLSLLLLNKYKNINSINQHVGLKILKKMAYTTEIIEREMSHLDYLLITHIKSLREHKGWTQQELSKRMGVSISFVGNVENLNERHKYSIRHLALLQNAFNYQKISDLFDFDPPTHDKITLKIEITRSDNKDNTKNRILKAELKGIVLSNEFN